MDTPILDADVLLLIFSEADVQTQLELISTCQVLYKEGGKRFPPAKYVRSRTETHLKSFLRFMDADGGSRMRSLRTLHVDLKEPSESVAEQLSKMLTRLAPVSPLTELCIFPLETFLSVHPPLSQAIAALTTLEEIRFHDVGERSMELMRSMQAELATVSLRGMHDLIEEATDGSVFAHLQRFAGSLRELHLAGFGDAAHPLDGTPEYPLLSALSLEATSSSTFSAWHYVRAFPNLKSLKLGPEPYPVQRVEHAGLLERRRRNMAQLHTHGCWASLDTFEGSVPALWRLGLPSRCHVRCLEVCDKDAAWDEDMSAEMLRDVLCAARPAQLGLTTCYPALLGPAVADALVEACGATLPEFKLTVEVMPGRDQEEYTHLNDVMDVVGDVLRGFSRLADVFVIVNFVPIRPYRYNYSLAWRGTPPPGTTEDEDVDEETEETDADAWCDVLRYDVPSADIVGFCVFGHPKAGYDWAEYERDQRIRWWG